MRRLILAFAWVAALGAAPLLAEVSPPVQALSQVLQIPDAMVVMRDEGLVSAADMMPAMTEGPRGVDPSWQSAIDAIYDAAAMEAVFDATFDAELAGFPDSVAAATAFFSSDLGQRVLRLELEARRALADADVEATAQEIYGSLWRTDAVRQAQLEQFVTANDLIESNVMGALNANLAFLRGAAMEGGEGMGFDESDMVAQVWSGEAKVRAETRAWLLPYLNLAYQPLTDAELQAYIDFSLTAAGKKVNAAMFRAFEQVFDGLSRDLGRAYARHLVGQDI